MNPRESPGLEPGAARRHRGPTAKPLLLLSVVSWLLLQPLGAGAWGPRGHAAVGILALLWSREATRQALHNLLGSTDRDRIDAWCNWPDEIRGRSEWDWASPQHYVNIPRNADGYEAARDCREGRCVTESIKNYAGDLMDERLPRARRIEAFAWLCHLVGDLHQPLHCGFADDRGGNSTNVRFLDQRTNLHQFWDSELIDSRIASRDTLVESLHQEPGCVAGETIRWSPSEVDRWTDESHRLAGELAYPPATSIPAPFAEASWILIQQRIRLAATRLARILDATLGPGEVVVTSDP